MIAWLNLRGSLPDRREAFICGLQLHGYRVVEGVTTSPSPRDVLCTWNRIGQGQVAALAFEARGLPVLVAENAAWGNSFAGERWYSLARGFHNTGGRFPVGSNERWDELEVDLAPWRTRASEVVVLPQRGIGPPGVAMPYGWADRARRAHSARIRPHPGTKPCLPLELDLAEARLAVTWGSGAAIKALLWGVPVVSDMPGWIGEQDNSDSGRLAMFRRLAWAQVRLAEIASGDAIARLLE